MALIFTDLVWVLVHAATSTITGAHTDAILPAPRAHTLVRPYWAPGRTHRCAPTEQDAPQTGGRDFRVADGGGKSKGELARVRSWGEAVARLAVS